LRYALARAATWYVVKDELKRTLPPMHVVRDLLAAPLRLESELPVLTRIVEVPVFAPDGNVKTSPGYDAGSRTYLAPPARFVLPALPNSPSAADVAEARRLLIDELLGDFPFVASSDRAHAVALMLLPFVRDLIPGPTPIHLIDKPSPGTGASLLTDALCTVATGHPAAKTTEAGDEQEWRKRITALLLQGLPVVVIDNLRRRLDSAALSSAVTSPLFGDRRLGRNETVQVPVRCAFVVTANNAQLSTELTRRTVRIRLDAGLERPWMRQKFNHPRLIEWVRENHAHLAWAALVLGRSWIDSGRPLGERKIGMFEAWAEVLGGILNLVGIPGFLDPLEDLHAVADAETAALRAFIASWWESFRDRAIGTHDLFSLAKEFDLGDGTAQSRRTRLGYFLRSLRDRRFGNLRVAPAGSLRNAQQWKLQPTVCPACGGPSWSDPLDPASPCAHCSKSPLPPTTSPAGESRFDVNGAPGSSSALGTAHKAHTGSQASRLQSQGMSTDDHRHR
jgi:hypothetical protein